MTELQALQNHVNSLSVEGLTVKEWQEQDKRKTCQKYFAILNGTSISPILDYKNMNVFLLGLGKSEKIKTDVPKYSYSVIFTFGVIKWAVIVSGDLMPFEAIQKAIEQMNEQKRYFTSVECIDIA